MNTNYENCWPVWRTQSAAGLPGGPITQKPHNRQPSVRWHLVWLGVGIGMVLVGLCA